MRISELKIDWKATLGKGLQCVEVKPYYRYDDANKRTEDIEGYAYMCIVPAMKYDKVSIKVEQATPIFEIQEEGAIKFVEFEGIDGKAYIDFGTKNNDVKLSITADKVKELKGV